jgi:hypothetical protein
MRRSVLPRVYACMQADSSSRIDDKTKLGLPYSQSTRSLTTNPWSHSISCTVCMSREAPERGLHPSQCAESEWVVLWGLSDKTGQKNNKPKERSSRPAVAFRRPLREARGRMPAQNTRCFRCLCFRARRLFEPFDWSPAGGDWCS